MFNSLLARADDQVLNILQGGELIRFLPRNDAPVLVRGIFDKAFEVISDGEAGLMSFQPAIFIRVEDLGAQPIEEDDRFEVDGALFEVREVKRDGKGGIMILMHTL